MVYAWFVDIARVPAGVDGGRVRLAHGFGILNHKGYEGHQG